LERKGKEREDGLGKEGWEYLSAVVGMNGGMS
jgi:hypothetical protein